MTTPTAALIDALLCAWCGGSRVARACRCARENLAELAAAVRERHLLAVRRASIRRHNREVAS